MADDQDSEKQDLDWEMLLRGSHYNPDDFRAEVLADKAQREISDLLKADQEEVQPDVDR